MLCLVALACGLLRVAAVGRDALPIVLWHGLGDTADSPGIKGILDVLSNHTHSDALAIDTGGRDSSFFGNINTQLEEVSKVLQQNPALKDGFNAIGFSQGGQFLRGYIERYNDPPVRALMTWGSQHAGISEVPCSQEDSAVCRSTRYLVHNNAFSSFVQNRLIPAQYYKGSTESYEDYVEHSIFLADINNERSSKNTTYRKNLNSLDRFVMIEFKDDRTVIPRESALFLNVDENGVAIPLNETSYWTALGLKHMHQTGKLVSLTVEGEHMQINEDQLLEFVDTYFSSKKTSESISELSKLIHEVL